MSGKHTPGPWAWFANAKTKQVYLATERGGRCYVMDFERWGMSGVQPRFSDRNGELRGGIMHKVSELAKPDHNGDFAVDHPDALLIAAAPDLLAACKALQAEAAIRRCGLKIADDAIAKAEGAQREDGV